MDRRQFLHHSTAAAISATTINPWPTSPAPPEYTTTNARWQRTYDRALEVLAANVQVMPRYNQPVLIEGSVYQGIWMECGPHESLVYRRFRPDITRNSHMTFFYLQTPEGQFPSTNKITETSSANATGLGQVQMCVSLAATAWEFARAVRDEPFLLRAYDACSRWDGWLKRYRNTRGTGLVEGFCTYDTGMDNSPRWTGIPDRCPDKDARKYPPGLNLPRLCPDLSASVYGARVALAAMASALGRSAESDRWAESAAHLRQLILSRLYVPEDAAFYDLDAANRFVKIRCDILSRVCAEHVPDQKLFDILWTRQIHNPTAFWPPFPLPSVAIDDPQFVRPIPRNSWGGASQALTAMRATRWFDHYNRAAEFGSMMNTWCEAIQQDGTFRTQLDPTHGGFTQQDAPNYSPCALVMVDYTWRLAGIHEDADRFHWNIRPGHPAAQAATFRLRSDTGKSLELRYDTQGGANLLLAGKPLARLHSGIARLVTGKSGDAPALVGISEQPQTIRIQLTGRPLQTFTLRPNQRIDLA